jgi:hypothetical protein
MADWNIGELTRLILNDPIFIHPPAFVSRETADFTRGNDINMASTRQMNVTFLTATDVEMASFRIRKTIITSEELRRFI